MTTWIFTCFLTLCVWGWRMSYLCVYSMLHNKVNRLETLLLHRFIVHVVFLSIRSACFSYTMDKVMSRYSGLLALLEPHCLWQWALSFPVFNSCSSQWEEQLCNKLLRDPLETSTSYLSDTFFSSERYRIDQHLLPSLNLSWSHQNNPHQDN